MIRVRFATGLVIEYRLGNFTDTTDQLTRIFYARSDNTKQLLSILPASCGAVIEFEPASRVERQPVCDSPESAAKYLLEHIEEMRFGKSYLASLKRKLEDFDGRTSDWKRK
jgi:hypothetical protein